MKKLLILLVLFIGIYECYWPVPDKDKEHFEYYKDKVVTDKKIPKEELIYFRIITKERLKLYKQNRPVLNAGEKKIISKFKLWSDEQRRISSQQDECF